MTDSRTCRHCGQEYPIDGEMHYHHAPGCYVRESYERYPGLWIDKHPHI